MLSRATSARTPQGACTEWARNVLRAGGERAPCLLRANGLPMRQTGCQEKDSVSEKDLSRAWFSSEVFCVCLRRFLNPQKHAVRHKQLHSTDTKGRHALLGNTHQAAEQPNRPEQPDAGNRGAVTGGKQMDGFVALLTQVASDMGVPQHCIHTKRNQLPGFFRPTKDWDFLIVSPARKLIAVVELKSQVGSFGNNFNNRAEEALGSAADLWTAFRENVFPSQNAPWVGYLMAVERCAKSTTSVKIAEPHFKALPEFKATSYIDRYAILCRKMILERYYTAAALLWTADATTYGNVEASISIENFLSCFAGHLQGTANNFR